MKNRSILTPMWLLLAVAACITAVIVGYALFSLQQVGERFAGFIEVDQAGLTQLQDMYAQGLQSEIGRASCRVRL